ncbi:MAG: chemotaxis protein CheW [Thermoleophilia bacterium]|jgi:purine-binding chemotaxis protein CheW|nr:chemotaxis protein CheW [Thermoleophilia bacterium]
MATATETAEGTIQLVVFALADGEYGLPIEHVQEIIRYAPPRPLPEAPPGIEGVIDLRGRIVPVVDLKARFGLPPDRPETSRIVVVEVADSVIGVVVDEVAEVLTVGLDRTEPPPPVAAVNAPYLDAVAKVDERLLVIMDVDRLLGDVG